LAATIIDGRAIAQQIQTEVAAAIQARTADGLRPPGLAVVLVGEDGAVVVDIGITRFEGGRLVRDVDIAGAKERARLITLVPSGVGPMTVATLLSNTLSALERREG
jgi:methylenetetrahydrofolate dehydrogenase (NADP+)/methenyltetrahydrofolate cyclohydrolase